MVVDGHRVGAVAYSIYIPSYVPSYVRVPSHDSRARVHGK